MLSSHSKIEIERLSLRIQSLSQKFTSSIALDIEKKQNPQATVASESSIQTVALQYYQKRLIPILRSFLLFFRACSACSATSNDVLQDLQSLQLSPHISKYCFLKYKSQKHKLFQSTESSSKKLFQLDELLNFQWRFGVVASSNTMSTISKPFIQLQLETKDPKASSHLSKKKHLIELSVVEFYTMLTELEKARAQFDLLSK